MALHCKYRVEDTDDPWVLSFYYNYLHHGISCDRYMGYTAAGMQFFGKTPALIIGTALDRIGWTKSNAHITSTFFLFLSIPLWVSILLRMKYSRDLALSFGTSMLLLDPFFTIANSARYDAFVFFLVTASLWFSTSRLYFYAMVSAWIAFESHPLGIIAFFYISVQALSSLPSSPFSRHGLWKKIVFPAFGFLLGSFYYVSLHSGTLSRVPHILAEGNILLHGQINNFVYEYFFKTKYGRHIPELILILFSAWIYWTKKIYKENRLLNYFLAVLLVFTLVVMRPNMHYIVFIYPALLLLILRVFEVWSSLKNAIFLFLILYIPQYIFVYHLNHTFDLNEQIREMKSVVPRDNLPILGGPNEWFAFYDRDFYSLEYSGDFQKLGLTDFYLIEDDHFRNFPNQLKDWGRFGFSEKVLKSWPVNGQLFSVKLISKR